MVSITTNVSNLLKNKLQTILVMQKSQDIIPARLLQTFFRDPSPEGLVQGRRAYDVT